MQNQTKIIMMLEDLHEKGYTIQDLADLIRSLEEIPSSEITDQQTEEKVINEEITISLMEMGITQNLMGFEYIRDAINMIYNDSWYIHAITTKLYVDIAEKYGKNPHNIERGIRHAIETAFNTMDCNIQEKYFKNIVLKASGKPTNSQFLAIMADFFKAKHNKM